jgi:hypothetical protein
VFVIGEESLLLTRDGDVDRDPPTPRSRSRRSAGTPPAGLHDRTAFPAATDRLLATLQVFHQKRVLVKGLIILDYYDTHHEVFLGEMGGWVAEAKAKTREAIVDGLENAAAGLIAMLEGANFGKTIVTIGPE